MAKNRSTRLCLYLAVNPEQARPLNSEYQDSEEPQRTRANKSDATQSRAPVVLYEDFAAAEPFSPPAVAIAGDVFIHTRALADAGRLGELPDEWLAVAGWRVHTDAAEGRASSPRWESELWQLMRFMRAHPDWTGLTAKQSLKRFERVTGKWCLLDGPPNPADAWVDWFDLEAEEARVEWLERWDRIRFIDGHDILEQALARADREPIRFDPDDISIDTPGYKRFLAFAGWLQVVRGSNRPILLPVQKLAELFDMRTMTISSYRRLAERDGFITTTKKSYYGEGVARATQFKFDASRVPMLAEMAQRPNGKDSNDGA